jgi:F-type H+-transporting ATPase subunit epsilon
MATQLHVTIVTPERKVFDAPAAEILLPAWEGELGVFPDHDALLALLRAGRCTVSGSDGPSAFVVGRGFAEITGDAVTVLTSTCTPVSEVDRSRAATAVSQAEEALAAAEVGTEAFKQAEIALELARALAEA